MLSWRFWTPMACRMAHPQFARRHWPLITFLPLAACIAIGSLTASAQAFDTTDLHHPIEIGTVGVVQAGDNPAWAQPDFDDSKWLPVDERTSLNGYFPHQQSPIVWRRLRVKVSPQQTDLALQAYYISRAFDLYVNGQKLIESGQVDPFVPYTRDARIIVRIPEAQLRTGSLVIAIRARTPRSGWTNYGPGFLANMLTVGDESALRNQNLLNMIGENAASILADLLAVGVGLVALALFIAQRNHVEYLWIFLLGACITLDLASVVSVTTSNIPASWWTLTVLINLAERLVIVLIVQAFLRKRFGRLLWLFIMVALLIELALEAARPYGILPVNLSDFSWLPFGLIVAIILPLLVWREMRRGNFEAGILLIPLFLYSMELYVVTAFDVLVRIPPLRSISDALQTLLSLHFGIFNINLDDISNLTFFFSLAIIMVLRSTRMSRQQAVLEGEMAAAREVQKVILPDAVQTVPGFTVESVYQPAQQVGGDFFQILPDNRGGLLLVVGDVAGKGLPAAMLVSVLVGATRTAAAYSPSPSEILAQLNERLVGRTHGSFSTALAAHITADGWVTIANAGHLSPYLDGREVELHAALPLGVITSAEYETTQFHLPHAARLTFYSDGVVEAQNQKGELFGFDRAKAISTQPAAAIVDAAIEFGQSDDITVVAIRRAESLATAA
jgi:sigma-B regulation protein RsbU (phosphoserine phosphatase)